MRDQVRIGRFTENLSLERGSSMIVGSGIRTKDYNIGPSLISPNVLAEVISQDMQSSD